MKKPLIPSGKSILSPKDSAKPKKTMKELHPDLPFLPDYVGRPRYTAFANSVDHLRSRKQLNIVSVDQEILGGTPCFIGTRIPVSVLFENLADGLTLDEILEDFPTLPRDLAIKALKEAGLLLAKN
jgi:uncharacterized protein (DUF433 family)